MKELDIIEYKNALQGLMELATEHADAVMAYYNALTKSGFTQNEALKIVIHQGFSPPMPTSGDSDD